VEAERADASANRRFCCPSCSVAYGCGAAYRDAAPAERLDTRVTMGLWPPRGAPVGRPAAGNVPAVERAAGPGGVDLGVPSGVGSAQADRRPGAASLDGPGPPPPHHSPCSDGRSLKVTTPALDALAAPRKAPRYDVRVVKRVDLRIIWHVLFALNGTKSERVSGLKSGR
jgi:hypothetical protein